MNQDSGKEFSVESALRASQNGALREWVIDFLQGPGGNIKFADGLIENLNIKFSGPVESELASMKRIAGPAHEGLRYVDNEWEENVEKMVDAIGAGWNPPPLIMSDYFEPGGSLSDGNHRCEALIRAGYKKYWTIYLENHPDH